MDIIYENKEMVYVDVYDSDEEGGIFEEQWGVNHYKDLNILRNKMNLGYLLNFNSDILKVSKDTFELESYDKDELGSDRVWGVINKHVHDLQIILLTITGNTNPVKVNMGPLMDDVWENLDIVYKNLIIFNEYKNNQRINEFCKINIHRIQRYYDDYRDLCNFTL